MATARRRRYLREARDETRYADPSEVASRAWEMEPDYALCRGIIRHEWNRRAVRIEHTDDGYLEVTVKCRGCKTEKTQTLTRYGGIVSAARYRYPDGYQMRGVGYLDQDGRDALRLISMQRLDPSIDQPAPPTPIAKARANGNGKAKSSSRDTRKKGA